MNALVTGAGGFSGSHLVRLLREQGHTVTAAGHHAEVEVDFLDALQVERLCGDVRPDVIFHLAGTSHISAMRENPMAAHLNVVKPVVTLLDEVFNRHRSTRIVLVSTCSVYGRPQKLPIPEDHPLQPVDTYGSARAAVEHVVKGYLPHGIDVVIARAFNHTGRGQDTRFALPDWRAQQREGPSLLAGGQGGGIVRVGNLDVRRDYSDVRDIVAGYLLLAERGVTGEAYNLCSGQAVSMRTLFERACPSATAVVDETRVRRVEVPILWGDPSKAEALGWTRRHSLDDALQELG